METKSESVKTVCLSVCEWTLPNFASCQRKSMMSKVFRVGGYAWKLVYHPGPPYSAALAGVSLRLCHWDPTSQRPGVNVFATVANNRKDNDTTRAFAPPVYTKGGVDYAHVRFLAPDKLSTANGFLSADGALVIIAGVQVRNPIIQPSPLRSNLGPAGLAGDLLVLLDKDPGATSDLTIIAGGGDGVAKGSDGAGGSSSTSSTSTSSITTYTRPQRSFRVHRAVLAARCPFFRTLFNAGMADSAARELPLPDADPDAFAVLLRYMYGGEVPLCCRAIHRAAVPLCDTLLLFDLKTALEAELVRSADEETIVGDLLWAAGHGREEVLEELVVVYTRVAKDVDVRHIMALAVANPQLAGRLLVELARQQQQQAGESGPVGRLNAVMTNRHLT